MVQKSKGQVVLIGRDRVPIVVCDIVNGKPKVKRRVKDDCFEYVLRYSLFRKEIKRYDKKSFEEIK